VALVGHEPDLSRWAGWFLTTHEKSLVLMKKGAACFIAFPGKLAAGKGVLHALFQPRHLRKLH
jgi:phosphohistidine phosphatase SixA